MRAFTWLRAGLALGLPIVALWGASPSQATGSDDDPVDASYTFVFAEPQLRGDVRFLLWSTGFQQGSELAGIIRTSLHCDWRPVMTGRRTAQGTCRRLLPAHGGAVTATLDLAPLAVALRRAGATEVRFNLAAVGEPGSAGSAHWIAGEAGKTADTGKLQDIGNWKFRSLEDGEWPPPFAVRLGSGWSLSRLFIPLLFVLCGPAALALCLRRRIARAAATPGSGVVWLNWILLGAWLYWISKVGLQDLIGFAAAMDIDQWLVTLLLGAVLFCGPPLAAVAACLLALSPQTYGKREPARVWRMVRVGVASQALFVVPLGLFLMGTALVSQEFSAGLFSVLAAYAAFRALGWCIWRWTSRRITALTGGELYTRAVEIAGAAKVQLKGLNLLENRSPLEANAFAAAGGRVSLTRGLVENLSRREVDAVIGHELGHLRGKHIGTRLTLLLAYLFVVGPAAESFLVKTGLPEWALALPIVPLLYVLAASWISQRHELSADARAVRLTNDPEGTIAALARLGRLTQSPIDWGGIQGSILSHPSMRRRVLAVARRFGVPDARALEILHDPDVLGGRSEGDAAPAAGYAIPAEAQARKLVFTPSARMSHIYWIKWFFGGSLTGLLLLVHLVSLRYGLGYSGRLLAFLGSLPLVFWMALAIDEWWASLFIRRMRRKIESAGGTPPSGVFVALLPGERVVAFEGIYAWDLGRLSLDAERLTYQGEHARFSVARAAVEAIEVRRGPLSWVRTYVVMVRSAQGSFSLRLADRGRSRRMARRLESQMRMWWRGETAPIAAAPEALPAPALPNLAPALRPRRGVVWHIAKTTVLMGIGAFLVCATLLGYTQKTLVPLAAACIYLLTATPVLLRRRA
ncbi:MAG: M48 family metallopeptidase [Bryobacteraceae bacterium]